MIKGIVFTSSPVQQVKWSQPMDAVKWLSDIGVIKVTTCFNRFEILMNDADIPSDGVSEWAHQQVDKWLQSRTK